MATGTYEYQSDFARHYVGKGKAEGRVEDRREAILTVLAARGLDVTPAIRERITACTDHSKRTTWHERAVTATRAENIFT